MASQEQYVSVNVAAARPSNSAPLAPASMPTAARSRPDLLSPPHHTGQGGLWLGLVLCLLAATAPLVLELQRPMVTDPGEARTLATSIQSWDRLTALRQSGATTWTDPLVPYHNGQAQWTRPPGTVWAHLLVFEVAYRLGLAQDTEHLVLWARLDSALMALALVAAVYWAGQSLGGAPAAVYAALVCAANLLWIQQGRQAAPAIHAVAWAWLSAAAALWAIRPMRPAPSSWRQGLGWTICGLTWGAAMLNIGLAPLLVVGLPLLAVLVMCPGRTSHLLGLLAALLIGILVALPWVVFAQSNDPQAWPALGVALLGSEGFRWQALAAGLGRQALWLPAVLLPWTLWLVGAVVQPLSTSSAGLRLRLSLGLVWAAVVTLVLLLLPSTKQPEEWLPLVPAVALLLAQLFKQYDDLAAVGHYARFWRILRWPHLTILMLVSVALPTWLLNRALPAGDTLLAQPLDYCNPRLLFYPGLAMALLGIWLLSVRWSIQNFPGRALAAWALWLIVLASVLLFPWVRQGERQNPVAGEARQVLALAQDRPVLWLRRGSADPVAPRADLLLYVRRPIPAVLADELHETSGEHAGVYLLSPAERVPPIEGAQLVQRLPHAGLALWRYQPAAALIPSP